jgi:hypothetical protein
MIACLWLHAEAQRVSNATYLELSDEMAGNLRRAAGGIAKSLESKRHKTLLVRRNITGGLVISF